MKTEDLIKGNKYLCIQNNHRLDGVVLKYTGETSIELIRAGAWVFKKRDRSSVHFQTKSINEMLVPLNDIGSLLYEQ